MRIDPSRFGNFRIGSNQVRIDAATVVIDAHQVTINSGMVRVSGVLQADTDITNSVISASYTPGAGNIW